MDSAGDSDAAETPDDEARLTDAGTVVGTVAYMSPEQALGEQADHRSDLFSLGVVLYELLTGRLPFTGRTSSAVIDAVLHQEPAPIPRFNNEAPDVLVDIVGKLLEKDCTRRYQSARDVWTDLRRAQEVATEAVPDRKSIAVLPFKDLSPQHDQDYFCEGLAEELINALTKVKGLRVAARTSSFSFKGKNADIRDIGRTLNVQTLLEGSVQKSGNTLRVTAQLINIADGYHIWSERFDRKTKDVFAVQDEISLAIVEKLSVGLLAGEREEITRRQTLDKDAHNMYIKGRYFWNRRYQADMIRAVSCYEKAIAIDPGYAQPYVGIADVFNILGMWAFVQPDEAAATSRKALERALAIDPELGDAYCSLGFLSFTRDHAYQAADEYLRRGIELNPSNSFAHGWYAIYLSSVRRDQEAVAEARKATSLDPLFSLLKAIEGIVTALAGEVGRGREILERAIELNPSQPLSYLFLGFACIQRPAAPERAVEMFQKAVGLGIVFAEGWVGLAYAMAGRTDDALQVLERLRRLEREPYLPLSRRLVVNVVPSLKLFRPFKTRIRLADSARGDLSRVEQDGGGVARVRGVGCGQRLFPVVALHDRRDRPAVDQGLRRPSEIPGDAGEDRPGLTPPAVPAALPLCLKSVYLGLPLRLGRFPVVGTIGGRRRRRWIDLFARHQPLSQPCMRRVVSASEQLVERGWRKLARLAHLHARPGAVRASRRIPAQEPEMPLEELRRPGPAVLVVAPVLERQVDVPPIHGQAVLGGKRHVSGRDLAEEPRPDERAAGGHDAGAAGLADGRLSLVPEQQVAVADDRHRHRGSHLADRIPVGRLPVPGVAGPAVDHQRVGPAVDGRARDIEEIAVVVIPPEAELHRDRDADDLALHRLDDSTYPLGLARQRGAHPLPGEVVDRTPEVHVDEVDAAGLDQCGRPAHLFGVGPGELNAEAGLVGAPANQRELRTPPLLEAPRDGHLADGHARPELDAQPAKRQVAALRHRPQNHRTRETLDERQRSTPRTGDSRPSCRAGATRRKYTSCQDSTGHSTSG